MINIKELSNKIKQEGYNEELAEAKLCQDIILLLLSKSKFNKNITIKGGVVMRSLSNNARRATIDIDLDLIRYPLTVNGIRDLFKALNGIENISIKIIGKIEDLKHQDYEGKRVHINIKDSFGNNLTSKMDIGVHKYLSLTQSEYCFDIAASNEGASLLINSKEQMFTEKLKSLLRFGYLSTRFKDIYDIYYLSDKLDKSELINCFNILIFQDKQMKEHSIDDIINRVESTINNNIYRNNLSTSNKNWLEIDDEIVLKGIVNYLKSLNNSK